MADVTQQTNTWAEAELLGGPLDGERTPHARFAEAPALLCLLNGTVFRLEVPATVSRERLEVYVAGAYLYCGRCQAAHWRRVRRVLGGWEPEPAHEGAL